MKKLRSAAKLFCVSGVLLVVRRQYHFHFASGHRSVRHRSVIGALFVNEVIVELAIDPVGTSGSDERIVPFK